MRNLRLIARLDVKKEWLIKGVQMEGWRKVGDPQAYAKSYADKGADELLFMDVVASLYNRNNLHDIVERVASEVFIPMTVGGGIRSATDVSTLLAKGADKVALNTAATRTPKLIREISDRFGAQATVISIEAIKRGPNSWEPMTDNGRNKTERDVVEWAKEVEQNGAGEIVVTSIDRDGRGTGFDIELAKAVSNAVTIPVVASGGLGAPEHLSVLLKETDVSAAATAQALHWEKTNLAQLRETLADNGCFLRPVA